MYIYRLKRTVIFPFTKYMVDVYIFPSQPFVTFHQGTI